MFNSCYNLRDKINFKVFHSQYSCVNWTNSILTEEVDMGFPKQELYMFSNLQKELLSNYRMFLPSADCIIDKIFEPKTD
jgi:hypothetical protein